MLAGAGCGPQCEPEPDISVTLTPEAEEVRSLPVLTSGKVKLLDVDVPDAHGDVKVKLAVDGVDSVTVDSLVFEQQVAGQTKQVDLLRTQHGDDEFEVATQAESGSVFRFVWRVKNLAEYLLPEGGAHTSKVKLGWGFRGCRTQGGEATVDVAGTVKSPSTPRNFELVSAEAGRFLAAQGPKARVSLKSKLTNQTLTGIANEKFTVTFFSEGLPPIIAYGTADAAQIALRVNGAPGSQLPPSGTLEAFTSTNASAGSAMWENAGVGASSAALIGGGKAVVKLEIESENPNTQIRSTDTVVTLVDVP